MTLTHFRKILAYTRLPTHHRFVIMMEFCDGIFYSSLHHVDAKSLEEATCLLSVWPPAHLAHL